MGKAHSSLLFAVAFSLSFYGQATADELRCEGPFALDTTHAKLVTAFGAKNVSREIIYGPEGVTFKASVVFGKDTARRLEVIWDDEKAGKRPARIHFSGTGWSIGNNLHVGSLLAEVEAANARPFTLYGFEWDFGGMVSSWKGGALEKLPGGCAAVAHFEEDQNSAEEALTKAAGDHEFSSQDAAMKAVHPKVMVLGVQYSRK
ncbi:hypothetical protein [Microvirga terricola]|uniref:Uncharacterized protein n=1 Tax=Microvirga terricola TaxID=2719797 RepID=A0ABX0VCL3_9HYPH|nr:hypothetical protein [Microvirga terricola]NIX77156.1 hypothetical protein [Microvirga terricola]